MKTLKILFVAVVILSLIAGPAYAKKGENKGKGKGKQEKPEKGNNGQQKTPPANGQADSEKRNHSIDKGRKDADQRANRPEQRGKSAERSQGRFKDAKAQGKDFFKALEKARWSHNPHDQRGQGNMGKPRMRDPYGHDKDSGREKSERGRPIRETDQGLTLNLAEIIGIDFNITDYWLLMFQQALERYQALAEQYSTSWYSRHVTWLESYIASYIASGYTMLAVNLAETIDYTLKLNPPEEFAGTTLLVTTSLISINEYTYTMPRYTLISLAPAAGISTGGTQTIIHYEAGGVITEQTQEVVLGTDNTIDFSYDPPTYLAPSGLYADVVVTVTEPESGASYTVTYDRNLYLYRCPYGKVTNAKTNQPIPGAKVIVHYEDGTVVALDKASNPTAKNPQTTDATGRYGFKLKTGRKYYLTAAADGYKDYKSPIFTEKWHVLREDVALSPQEANLAQNVE